MRSTDGWVEWQQQSNIVSTLLVLQARFRQHWRWPCRRVLIRDVQRCTSCFSSRALIVKAAMPGLGRQSRSRRSVG